ncbi:cell division protein SepF [Nocardia camponoti]|uniref:Cell division protein SepF n=1 Tax=Nocardia camponoti TaxID=1616106 RepID=A0A917QSP5_9NOCA|nr:cell division protein SepF [Nocardia camponoti]GGK65973.1 cell division protein SepF [Nocardia camponoti]
MSTLHKFKAYFGMVPLDEYEDDYVDDTAPRVADERAAVRPRQRSYDRYAEDRYGVDRFDDEDYPKPAYQPTYQARRDDFLGDAYGDDRYEAPRRPTRIDTAPSSGQRFRPGGVAPGMRGSTRGALAVDPDVEERRLDERMRPEQTARSRPGIFEDGGSLSKITTLRPRDYSEARIIGERFREGNPVIMDLVDLSNADAKRLVDFAAGLAFALRGSFDKVATKVFLLSPADVDVSAEERRRIAENGFYNQK